MSYGGATGNSRISTAADAALSNPADADVLTYDGATQKWKNAPASSGGGSGGANDTLATNAAAHGILPSNSDNATALNALITTLSNNGGGTIQLPPGTYAFASSIILKQGVYLASMSPNHGYTAGIRTVAFTATSAVSGYLIDTVGGGIASAGGSGINITGNGVCGGVRMSRIAWGAWRNSHIDACGLSGLWEGGGFACKFTDLLITNSVSSTASSLSGAFDIGNTVDNIVGTDHYVSHCECTSGSGNGQIKSTSRYCNAGIVRGSNHFIDDCVFETSDRGLIVYCQYSRFTAVRCDTNNGDGWYIYGGANTFTACEAIGNSQAGSGLYDDFIIDNPALANYFVNCHSRLAQGSSIQPRYGFDVQTNNKEPTVGGVYVGCSVEAATQRWRTVNGPGSGIQFAPSTIQPAAGTTALDLHETSGIVDLSLYTSAATIVNMFGGNDGQTVRLLGNPNVTIQNNGTIKPAGGADQTLVAGKVYPFTCYLNVWYGE